MTNVSAYPVEDPFVRPAAWAMREYPVDGAVLTRALETLALDGTIEDIMRPVPNAAEPGAEVFPNLTRRLAQFGVPTTRVPRDPGELDVFAERWLADLQVDKLADNMLACTKGLLTTKLEGHENVGELEQIRRILNIFGRVQDARFDNVHLEDEVVHKNGERDGTVVFGHTQLFMETEGEARELSGILSKWLESESRNDSEHLRSVNHHTNPAENGAPATYSVDILNMNEFDWHVLEIGCERLMARWLKATTGTILPVDKATLKQWLEVGGETFDPVALAYLQNVIDGYHKMIVGLSGKATYGGEYFGSQPVVDPNPFGTVPAPIFEVTRKVRKGISDKMTARHGNNPVQHRRRTRRLRLERYVGIQRTQVDHSKPGKYSAPGGLYATKLREKGAAALEEAGGDVRGTTIKVARKLGPEVVGGIGLGGIGVLGLAASAVAEVAPLAIKAATSRTRIRRAWNEQRAAAHSAETRQRVAGPLTELLLRQTSPPSAQAA